ncbi:MAG: tRNA 2-thiouridine(34) synthase MnmA [Bacteroidota bacterium]
MASNVRKKVVVAMSGGVDSSVAAALLIEAGYDIIGITLKTCQYENIYNRKTCCSPDHINDARTVASKLGFPHQVIDVSEKFEQLVIDYFVDEYLAGRTPNPCVVCNPGVKWSELIRKADELDAEFIATGHYARIRLDQTLNRYVLSKGKDESKDQSYALWGLDQKLLGRTLFPLAELTKHEVRALAAKFELFPATKDESFEICFIPDDDYARFLREKVKGLKERVDDGEVVIDGKVVGRHEGYPFYTIGQRRGLGISSAAPLYVISIDPQNNRIILGGEGELLHRGLMASHVNTIKYEKIREPKRLSGKIRYKDPGSMAVVRTSENGSLEVLFDEPKRAMTPGQSIVLYEGDDVVGGGIIDRIIP